MFGSFVGVVIIKCNKVKVSKKCRKFVKNLGLVETVVGFAL